MSILSEGGLAGGVGFILFPYGAFFVAAAAGGEQGGDGQGGKRVLEEFVHGGFQ